MEKIITKNGNYYYQVSKVPKWVLQKASKIMLSEPIWSHGGKMDLIGKTYRYIIIKKHVRQGAHPDDIEINIFKRRRGIIKTEHKVSNIGDKDFTPDLYNI